MPLNLRKLLPSASAGVVLSALVAATILHILATLAAPRLAPSPAYRRLAELLPPNTMQVLAPIAPGAQPLPFMAADARYAVCRFDTTKGGVRINAGLPGAGWSLTLYTDKGDSIYTAVAQPGRRTDVALQLSTADERFAGLTPEAAGGEVKLDRSLSLTAKRGLAILRAPDQGLAYRAANEAELKRSVCAVSGAVASR
jgi:uncharacterized membrane protein